ncbi:MAG: hypothetical protein ACOCVZ_04275 [Gemmatimonadota bacterium]
MKRSTLGGCPERHRQEAIRELTEELKGFSAAGLVRLHDDLGAGRVVRGGWSGCVLSYRRGQPGSARHDRAGRSRNTFTALWDSGWLSDEEVRAAVAGELGRRASMRRPRSSTLSSAGPRSG